MNVIYQYLLGLLICCCSPIIYAQQALSPKIINFDNEQYHAGFQNWSIAQDQLGYTYIANSEGLLTFNGFYWRLYKMPNQTMIRAIDIDESGKIYIGAQDEFGYFLPDSQGKLIYHSLKHSIPEEERLLNDVWNVLHEKNAVFFREPNKIILHDLKETKVFKPKGTWTFLGKSNHEIYAQDSEYGLMRFQFGVWKLVSPNTSFNNSIITSIIELKNGDRLVSTQNQGLFILSANAVRPLPIAAAHSALYKHIYSGIKLKNGNIAYGTVSYGLIEISENGQLVQQINRKKDILSNNIRAVFEDNLGNIWLGLDNGISIIHANSSIKYIYPDRDKDLTGYASIFFNNQLWLGTSDAVYSGHLNSSFQRIPGTEGQVWNLQDIEGELILSHDQGMINLSKPKKANAQFGTWLLSPSSAVLPNPFYYIGAYNGLYTTSLADFTAAPTAISGINESLRFLVLDEKTNQLWASHPNRGIYRFTIKPGSHSIDKLDIFGVKDGLPNDLHNYIFKINHEIVASTVDGVYVFNTSQQQFIPHPLLHGITKNMSIQFLKQDAIGNIWMASQKKVFVLKKQNENKYQLQEIPELKDKIVGGHESINLQDLEHVIIGSKNGFIHINYHSYKRSKPLVYFNNIIVSSERDTLLSNYLADKEIQAYRKLSSFENGIHFEFGSTEYNYPNNLEFSFQLVGYDSKFSEWDMKNEKDYTNLSPGKYTFKVKSRFGHSLISDEKTFSFEILPPWYRTKLAFLFYLILAATAGYYFLKNQKNRFNKKHAQLSILHRLEIENSEKEIIRLKNEKLQSEVTFKNKELTAITMHLVQRAEVMDKLKAVIKEANKKNAAPKETNNTLLRLIKLAEKSEEEHQNFYQHLQEVNQEFFDKLKAKFPSLTANELKLCAYLKMELSTKEIAQLLNVSIKAVEVSRYRLRKKMELTGQVKLAQYLQNL